MVVIGCLQYNADSAYIYGIRSRVYINVSLNYSNIKRQYPTGHIELEGLALGIMNRLSHHECYSEWPSMVFYSPDSCTLLVDVAGL